MINTALYESPIGKLLIATKDEKLIGLWMENQKYYPEDMIINNKIDTCMETTIEWLDKYFDKENPDINKLKLEPGEANLEK